MRKNAGLNTATSAEIESMGLWLVDLMSEAQLAAAAERYHSTIAAETQFMVPSTLLQKTWMNHWQRVVRMPAGGAAAGGSMQTGFEMELVSEPAIRALMEGWPNHQALPRGGHSWEARTMEDAGRLRFADWGVLNGKPIPPLPSTQDYRGVIMVSPPVTVSWQVKPAGCNGIRKMKRKHHFAPEQRITLKQKAPAAPST